MRDRAQEVEDGSPSASGTMDRPSDVPAMGMTVRNLRGSIARILNQDDRPVGAAFVIDDRTGLLVTCAHVVRAAGVNRKRHVALDFLISSEPGAGGGLSSKLGAGGGRERPTRQPLLTPSPWTRRYAYIAPEYWRERARNEGPPLEELVSPEEIPHCRPALERDTGEDIAVLRLVGVHRRLKVKVGVRRRRRQLTVRPTRTWFDARSGNVIQGRARQHLPAGVSEVLLGSSDHAHGHPFLTYGFPRGDLVAVYEGSGTIRTRTQEARHDPEPNGTRGVDVMQLDSQAIAPVSVGFSGAPVLDQETHRVIGMITTHDATGFNEGYTVFMTPSEVLRRVYPALQLSDRQPYRGLAAFRSEDTDLYYGRRDLVENLATLLAHRRLVVVEGPSGSGKSSLIGAGLLPRLRRESGWGDSIVLRPSTAGADSCAQIAQQIAGDLMVSDLPDAVRRWTSRHGQRRLLVIDQLEEIFVAWNGDEQRKFNDQMLSLFVDRSGRGDDGPRAGEEEGAHQSLQTERAFVLRVGSGACEERGAGNRGVAAKKDDDGAGQTKMEDVLGGKGTAGQKKTRAVGVQGIGHAVTGEDEEARGRGGLADRGREGGGTDDDVGVGPALRGVEGDDLEQGGRVVLGTAQRRRRRGSRGCRGGEGGGVGGEVGVADEDGDGGSGGLRKVGDGEDGALGELGDRPGRFLQGREGRSQGQVPERGVRSDVERLDRVRRHRGEGVVVEKEAAEGGQGGQGVVDGGRPRRAPGQNLRREERVRPCPNYQQGVQVLRGGGMDGKGRVAGKKAGTAIETVGAKKEEADARGRVDDLKEGGGGAERGADAVGREGAGEGGRSENGREVGVAGDKGRDGAIEEGAAEGGEGGVGGGGLDPEAILRGLDGGKSFLCGGGPRGRRQPEGRRVVVGGRVNGEGGCPLLSVLKVVPARAPVVSEDVQGGALFVGQVGAEVEG